MQAAAVDILVQKGKFDPQVALAVTEAIDMAISNSQLVTVPVLDARFAAHESRMDARFAKMDARFDVQEVRFDAKLHALKTELQASQQDIKRELQVSQQEMKADLLGNIHKMKSQLFFWIVVLMLGSNHLPLIVTKVEEAVRVLF